MTELKTILLAEDNTRDVELTLAALAEDNLANEVVIVNDGADALDYLHCRGRFSGRARINPVVALLDLKMPKVDGLEVLRAIKTDERTKVIPVVVMTSSQEQRDIVESYQLGVNSYIVKPVDFDNFSAAVAELGCYWLLLNQLPHEPPQPPPSH